MSYIFCRSRVFEASVVDEPNRSRPESLPHHPWRSEFQRRRHPPRGEHRSEIRTRRVRRSTPRSWSKQRRSDPVLSSRSQGSLPRSRYYQMIQIKNRGLNRSVEFFANCTIDAKTLARSRSARAEIQEGRPDSLGLGINESRLDQTFLAFRAFASEMQW